MPSTSASLLVVTLLLFVQAVRPHNASAQRGKSSSPGAFSSGSYRNLIEERGISRALIDTRLETTFQQLFHGDPKTQAIYYAAGANDNGPMGYVTDVANHDARTEGMSYGMMVAVQTGHKAEFDAIWNWANTYMLITDLKNPSVGYYAWSMNTDGTPRSDSPAPDGEEYFVMSLYFAAHRWGNGAGLYDYEAQANRLLKLMRHHPVLTEAGPFRIHPTDAPFISQRHPDPAAHPGTAANWGPRTTTVGPMVNEANTMVVFVPGAGANTFSDPSYHLPAFYELWARWGPMEDRPFWAAAAERSRRFFSEATDANTGLAPDYANFDGTPHTAPFNATSGDFSYDSWRTVSNWSVDQAWWSKDPKAQELSDRIQRFLISQGIRTFSDQYTLDGKPLSHRHSTGMVATTAVGGLAATPGPAANAFLDELWATPIPSGEQRYYDGLLYMMSLLHTTGHFRIWMPQTP